MTKNKVLALVPVVGLSFALLTLAPSPGHGYVSVAAGGFSPVTDDCDYLNQGYEVRSQSGVCTFVAPVQLPQGATVTKIIATWEDYSSSDGYAGLDAVSTAALSQTILFTAYTESDKGFGTSESADPNHTVDNSQYAYYVRWFVPNPAVYGRAIVIEYTYPTSLPLVLRNFLSGPGGR